MMKKYYFNVFLIFIFVLAVIFLSSSFVYTQTSNKLREQTAADTVSDISRQVAIAIDLRLENDYNVFKDFVSEYETVAELNANKDELTLSGVGIAGFGKIKEDIFNDGEDDFPASEEFKSAGYYNQKIAVYRLKDVFTGHEEETEYCFFKHGDIVGYFSAAQYFAPLFSRGADPENTGLIAS